METESQNSRARQSRSEAGPQPDRINQRGKSIEISMQELQMSPSLCQKNDALKRIFNDSDEKELLSDWDSYGMFFGRKILKITPVMRWESVSKTTLIHFKFKGKITKLYFGKNDKDIVGLIHTYTVSNFESLRKKKAIFYEVRKYNNSMISISIYLNPRFNSEHDIKGYNSFRKLLPDLGYQLTKPATISLIFETEKLKNPIELDTQTVNKNTYDSYPSMPVDPKERSKKVSETILIGTQKPDFEGAKMSQDAKEILDMRNLKSNRLELYGVEQLTFPPAEFTSQLRTYQKEGLKWMIAQEGNLTELDKELQSQSHPNLHMMIEEWTNNKGIKIYFDTQNVQILTEPPYSEQVLGGILADSAGLGKKVMTLALILSNPRKKDLGFLRIDTSESESIQDLPLTKSKIAWKPSHSSVSSQLAPKQVLGGTLIVCPSKHEDLWRNEIAKHTEQQSFLKVLYYGDIEQKHITAEMISQNDIVIVTYDLLSKEEIPFNRAILTSVYWHRVVLDEAHYTIKNTNFVPGAVFKLESKYRWILSRTPSQHMADTLHNKLEFLRICPWALKELGWKNLISQAQSSPQLLYSVLRPITLWRTEECLNLADQKAIRLPITINVKLITLQKDEREIYQEAKKEIEAKLHELDKEKSSPDKSVVITAKIEFLLRNIKGVCNHPLLQKFNGRLRKILGVDIVEKLKNLIRKAGMNLNIAETHSNIPEVQNGISRSLLEKLNSLQSNQVEDCSICLNQPEEIVFTVCGHTYCQGCFYKFRLYRSSCACCNKQLKEILSFDRIYLNLESIINKRSSKVDAVITSIEAVARQKEKCLCFTSWIAMMDILALEMKKCGINFVMIDNSCTQEKKGQLLKEFSEETDITVAIMCLEPNTIESDLTKANHLLLVEPCWNPINEEQVIELVHRNGQTKPVFVTRFACKETIEERILNLSEYKKKTSSITPEQEFKFLLDIS